MNAQQLLNPSRFCNVLSRARSARVRGSWEGSAYRSHPCGMIVGNMRLANHWSVHNHCTIVLGTTDKWRMGQNRPEWNGDPFPHCIDGEEVRVWSDGRWVSEEFREALEGRVVAILNRALADVAAKNSWDNAVEMLARQVESAKRAATARAALNLAIGA